MEELQSTQVVLQKLSPKHKEALSLVAQGLSRTDVAAIAGYTPEYISWLVRQDVCREYLAEMMAIVDFRLEAMTGESVDAIQEVLRDGAPEDRLKAAKLQLEAIGRVGAGKNAQPNAPLHPDHLNQLADRLVSLLKSSRVSAGVTYDQEPEDAKRA